MDAKETDLKSIYSTVSLSTFYNKILRISQHCSREFVNPTFPNPNLGNINKQLIHAKVVKNDVLRLVNIHFFLPRQHKHFVRNQRYLTSQTITMFFF